MSRNALRPNWPRWMTSTARRNPLGCGRVPKWSCCRPNPSSSLIRLPHESTSIS